MQRMVPPQRLLLAASVLIASASLQELHAGEPPLNGLAAYYPFDGNANDESVNRNPSVVRGARLAQDRLRVASAAFAFDGVNDVITAEEEKGLPFGNSNFSVTVWLYVDSGYQSDYRFILGNDYAGAFGLFIGPGTDLQFYTGNNGELVRSRPLPWTVKRWYHVAVVRTGSIIDVYRDGSRVASGTVSGGNVAPPGSRKLRFGTRSEGNQTFLGALDDIRIYNRDLSGQEVKDIYAWELDPPGPRRAHGTVTIRNGFIDAATVTNPGNEYIEPPPIRVDGGGGTGATLRAVLVGGKVTSIQIDNPGSGYASVPIISIASPPFAPSLEIEVSQVVVKMHLVLNRYYRLESSKDLKTWTPIEPNPFIAEAELVEREFETTETGRHFKLTEVRR
ncbi:MAG: LamG domain-containing protein [Verrucomicrobiales bacterium]|nr:LamG domain-containing protein [Verrucomicrobiales bacterium]